MASDSMRDRLYTTEAIVLSRLDYGEADRILTLFTPSRGKLNAIAKGARRPKSRAGPHLDFLARCSLQLARGRELDVVTSAETVEAHEGLRADLAAFGHGCHLAEVVRHLTRDRQEHRSVYELLAGSLTLLNDGVDPWPVTRHFELAALSAFGYQPELYQCLNCRQPIEAVPNAFSAQLGGIVCPRCRTIDPGAMPLSVNAQKYLRTLDRAGLSTAARLRPSEQERVEVESVLGTYLRTVAERDLSSLTILRSLTAGTDQFPDKSRPATTAAVWPEDDRSSVR
ncbi:MAG: DNA repair protein RecO [Chloroflexia bacterium]|nr:DNA repair protein RecO [Chloroflexia bacterium]